MKLGKRLRRVERDSCKLIPNLGWSHNNNFSQTNILNGGAVVGSIPYKSAMRIDTVWRDLELVIAYLHDELNPRWRLNEVS